MRRTRLLRIALEVREGGSIGKGKLRSSYESGVNLGLEITGDRRESCILIQRLNQVENLSGCGLRLLIVDLG